MSASHRHHVILAAILCSLAAVFAAQAGLSLGWLRVPAGAVFALFAPGYACLTVARQVRLSYSTRLVLSVPLSLSIAIVVCLALNATTYGIRPGPIIVVLGSLTIVLLVLGWAPGSIGTLLPRTVRSSVPPSQHGLGKEGGDFPMTDVSSVGAGDPPSIKSESAERDYLSHIETEAPSNVPPRQQTRGLSSHLRRAGVGHLVTAVALLGALTGAAIWTGYGIVQASREIPQPFTELSVTGVRASAGSTPRVMIRLGVTNRENRTMPYVLWLVTHNAGRTYRVERIWRIELRSDQSWEGRARVRIDCGGYTQGTLFVAGHGAVYRTVIVRSDCVAGTAKPK